MSDKNIKFIATTKKGVAYLSITDVVKVSAIKEWDDKAAFIEKHAAFKLHADNAGACSE